MEIFILWLFFSIVAAIIANKKGRAGVGFFLLSVVLSPLIGIVAALVVEENTNQVEVQKLSTGSSKKCPYCAEIIKSEAKVCRYCGKDLPRTIDAQNTGNKVNATSSLTQENYMTVEEFSKIKNIDETKVIEMIREGFYNGRLFDDNWYVHRSELA